MSDLVAIVEGLTEQIFVRDQLAEHLGIRGIWTNAILSGKKGKSGGVPQWASAKNDVLRALKQGNYVTTMFDFYGMPTDWPGREEAAGLPWNQRGDHVENAITQDVANAIGDKFDERQFIPYVQVHEFEALAFADVSILADKTAPLAGPHPQSLGEKFQSILDSAGNPEAINDNYETCPSRRIKEIVKRYRKPLNGPIITKAIGLEKLRRECAHFDGWLTRLEALGV